MWLSLVIVTVVLHLRVSTVCCALYLRVRSQATVAGVDTLANLYVCSSRWPMDYRINRMYLIAAAIISPCLSLILRDDSILARSICMLLVFASLIFAALFHNEWAKNQQRDQQD